MKTLELEVFRKYLKPTYTIGRFINVSDNNKILCDTLEDVVRDLHDYNHDGDFDDSGEGKVYGRTAIPAGRYKVIVTYSPKLKRRLPLLFGVPGFTGIRIHHGKNENWTEGCILVGENKIPGGLINGPFYETSIIQLIDTAINEGKEVYLTIKQ